MKVKQLPTIFIYLCFSILIFGFTSCRNAQKANPTNEEIQTQVKDTQSLLNAKFKYLLPSPDEIINIIFKEKINYKPELALKPQAESKIINSNYQAIMLGVYLSDFSYSLIFNDLNLSSKSLETIKELSKKLGIGGMFSEKFFSRIERNINNIDSLKVIYDNFSEQSFNTISKSGNDELLSLVAIGTALESIYLGYNAFKEDPYDSSLKPFFVEQRMVFENFYQNYLNFNGNKKDLFRLNRDLNSFYYDFKLNIWLIVDKSKLSRTDSSLTIDVRYNVKTSLENINNLGRSLCKLRENLIRLNYQ